MRKVIEQLVDDLTGEEISGNGRTVSFALDGKAYDIDLTDGNIEVLQEALVPYIAAARPQSAGPSKTASRRSVAPRASRGSKWSAGYEAVRKWAKENNIEVSAQGRVANAVMEAYENAHK